MINSQFVTIREVYALLEDVKEENKKNFDKIQFMFGTFHKEEFLPLQKTVDKASSYWHVTIGSISFLSVFIIEFVRNILTK